MDRSSSIVLLLALGGAGGIVAGGCGSALDDLFCENAGCELSGPEWQRLAALANLPAQPPPDPSNRYAGMPSAEALGQKLFYDTRFSGTATLVDQLRRPTSYGRAAKGQPINISCATCHDPGRSGIDVTSIPGNVSIGAGWFDVNAQATFNSGFYQLAFWNGRADSLWAQAALANEGGVSMNSNRLHDAWVLQDRYKAEYEAVFTDDPLPLVGTSAQTQASLDTDPARAGQCKLSPDCASAPGCREVVDPAGGASSCWPRFPLQGKPGARAGCQAGDAGEPFADAYDCMAPEDQTAVTRVLVNFGKAIAAYEFKLVSRDSPFDRFINEGPSSRALSGAALRGARLFVGKAACSDCHNTPLLSDNRFHNVGAPQSGPAVPTEADCPAGGVCDCVETPAGTAADGSPVAAKDAKNCLPWGGRDGLAKLKKSSFRRDSIWSDDRADGSRQGWVDMDLATIDRGAWRTPSLRDVALTAPYMHDGGYATLSEVVAHYNRGGSPDGIGTRAAQIKPLYLTPGEEEDLVAFLETLTGAPVAAELVTAPVLP